MVSKNGCPFSEANPAVTAMTCRAFTPQFAVIGVPRRTSDDRQTRDA
jgi:hypothetical protein